ncbi:YihY/virulence factor BrkB family protein [Lederbergia wuyishanensis]|uniref:Membrane protein n=1 Tax=Lederbergia wuyishanensis TaxID=1347903 RepID=A0ABU0D3S2_9BACI|nr:YihY/virulence factor BrkB family protein [Lederbergia wuyishanensis]MCJ8007781.1 YihY/virulence factor BrkB family protein [Lederbergia wuyishanensis]MDQ0343056.1 membrane protein [Lederbergia wuyishanensis]
MDRIRIIIKRFFIDRFHDQSAQMAYYFMLSIFPFLIFALSLVSFLPIRVEDILSAIEPFAPKGSFHLIKSNVLSIFGQQQTKIASFSLLAAFWIASMAVQSLVRAMNDAYNIVRKEGFFLAFGKDLILTLSIMITLTVSLLVPIAEELGRVFLASHVDLPPSFHSWWLLSKWVIGSVYLFFFFLFLYTVVPSTKVKLQSVIPGAVFATIGWQSVSIAFSYYVSYAASYTRLYGQLGNIIVLMIWFYFTAAVLLIGGLLNATWIIKKDK